jgi:hypothetical protein
MTAFASRRSIIRFYALVSVSLLLAVPVAGQTLFTDLTEQVGLDAFSGEEARNVVFVDFDNDGLQDVFITENEFSPRRIALYHNTGDGRLVDQTFRLPAEFNLKSGGAGSVFGDYDNDGDEDLFLVAWPHNVLLRNDRGLFTQVDPGSDLADSLQTENAIWMDYDRDGHLDLYVSSHFSDETYAPRANRLFRNQGDGTFADRTAVAGLDVLVHPRGGSWGGMAAGDFNDDGWPDLYVGVSGQANHLFLNDGQGGFEDATTGEIADEGEAFTVSIGDIDNDGDLDIFQAAGGSNEMGFRSLMLLNLGEGQFLDVTEAVGLGVGVLGSSADGTAFADVDNDGDLDLIIGLTIKESGWEPLFFLNDGTGTFVDHTAVSGIEDYGAYTAVGDYDEDGFVDLLYASLEREVTILYNNNGNENHWLRVELVGVESNRSGIGSRLLATSGELTQIREILGGVGRQEDERVAHFGLGDRTQVDRLEIRWPSGQVDVLTDIPADQKIRVFESREGYHAVRPTLWEHNLPDEVTRKTTLVMEAAVRPEPFEPGATTNRVTADLSELGGPTDLPLNLDEEGVYGLETSLEIDVLGGTYTVFVDIDQRTSLGDHWIQLSKTLTVLSDEGASLFGHAGEEGWTWQGQDLTRLADPPDHPGMEYAVSWSPDGTRLTFEAHRDGNWEIYVTDIDGGNQINLTRNPAYDSRPDWSPDGTKIAFYSDREEDWEVYVMDADGGNPTNLTMSDGYDGRPSWSPDGTKIAFFTKRDGNYEIYAMDADGGNPTNLTNHEATDRVPSWSPDGKRLTFQSYREGDGDVYVLDLETGDATKLAYGYAAPPSAWSPDGSQIVFESDLSGNYEIFVIDADGGDPIPLVHHPMQDVNPAWSPAGDRIAFVSNRTGNWDLYILTFGDASRVEIDPEQRETVFTGSEALAVRAGADWWLSCQPAEAFDWTGYGVLRFAFHPGDLAASAGEELSVWIGEQGVEQIGEQGVDLLEKGWIDLTVKEWQVVEIPFEQFELKKPIAAVDFSGDFTGTFYIDDLRLVPAKPTPGSTAVVEEHAAGLPLTSTLEQNYPNPFNSGTVIRFALPIREEVDLAVFNLAGQRVAALVDGQREAGTYAVRWDGRDESGRALASGVYLYRLRVGRQQVETRKLVLVR